MRLLTWIARTNATQKENCIVVNCIVVNLLSNKTTALLPKLNPYPDFARMLLLLLSELAEQKNTPCMARTHDIPLRRRTLFQLS